MGSKVKNRGEVKESYIWLLYWLLIGAAVWGELPRESKRHMCMFCHKSVYFPAPQISLEAVTAYFRWVSGKVC